MARPNDRPNARPAALRAAVRTGDDAAAWIRWVLTPPRRRLPQRILVTSLPKAGTNLVRKALASFPGTIDRRTGLFGATAPPARTGRSSVPIGVDWPASADATGVRRRLAAVPPGTVTLSHAPYSVELDTITRELEVAVIVVVRDPRAVAASLPPYVLSRPHHFLHDRFAAMDARERLSASIEGLAPDASGRGLLDLAQRFGSIARWADHGALLVRFEDLVGAAGGGDDVAQVRTVAALAEGVGATVSARQQAAVAQGLFGGTATFRRGSVDGWREDFAPEHHAAVRRVLGGSADVAGYDLGGDQRGP